MARARAGRGGGADAERIVRAPLERHAGLDVLVMAPSTAQPGRHQLMSRLAAELAFRPAGGGTIVNVTLSAHHGLPGMTHSSAARAAVAGYTRALAREWAADGIAAVAVAPGHFETDAIARYPEPIRRGAARSVPLQRSAASTSAAGWSRWSPRRSAARSRARSSRSTAAATTGSARGRSWRWARRSPARPAASRMGASDAGEVLWLHRSLPSF